MRFTHLENSSQHSSKNNGLQGPFVTTFECALGAKSPLCPQTARPDSDSEAAGKEGSSRASSAEEVDRSPAQTSIASGQGCGLLPGLVSSGTSHTLPSEPIIIDGAESRVKGMRKSVLTAARLIEDGLRVGGFRYKAAMLTLTYADILAWRPDHISKLTNHMRMYLKRRGHVLRGVWVAELQQRGAVHYHFVTWLPKGITFPKPDKQGWWPHGMTQWQWARRAVGYLVKYASKVETKHRFPRGCRISGACGLNRVQRTERRWWRLPVFVRRKWPDWHDDVIRAKGGGFVSRATGETMPPLYSFLGVSTGKIWLVMRDAPEWAEFIDLPLSSRLC